jgi:ribonuclease D
MAVEETENLPSVVPLLAPAEGTPSVITTDVELEYAISHLAQGAGPFAIDSERASGYKYSPRAYLIQIKRAGGGLHLIDPIAFVKPTTENIHPLFIKLNSLLGTDEVILHASTQDLPCLRDIGLNPVQLFDTELGARIAGLPRVALGTLLETQLGVSLAKEHSAVDWSTRPLPLEWLTYAALDVELLVELRGKISDLLSVQGKLEWATEEFRAILNAPAAPARKDPWRRTSGMHKVKNRHHLAMIRTLWYQRDELAREYDTAPGKLLSDGAIIELAIHAPTARKEMERVLRPIGLRSRWFEHSIQWLEAIQRGLALPETQWPDVRADIDSLPPVKIWRDRFPDQFARLSHARAAIEDEAHKLTIPAENLITPELIRRICWNPPDGTTTTSNPIAVHEALTALGARQWQATIVTPLLAIALLQSEPLPIPIDKGEKIENKIAVGHEHPLLGLEDRTD